MARDSICKRCERDVITCVDLEMNREGTRAHRTCLGHARLRKVSRPDRIVEEVRVLTRGSLRYLNVALHLQRIPKHRAVVAAARHPIADRIESRGVVGVVRSLVDG